MYIQVAQWRGSRRETVAISGRFPDLSEIFRIEGLSSAVASALVRNGYSPWPQGRGGVRIGFPTIRLPPELMTCPRSRDRQIR